MASVTLHPVERRVHAAAGPDVLPRHRERHFALDRLRFVAMVDIVSMHTMGDHLLHGVGLPMLLLVSVALQAGRVPPVEPSVVVARRARRLLVPWLFWSAVFAGWFTVQCLGHGQPAWGWLQPLMPLYGPAIHLWFVPFIFLSAPIVAVLAGAAHRRPRGPTLFVAAAAGGLIVLAAAVVRSSLDLPAPFNQWVFSVGTIPLGVAIGQALSADDRRRAGLLLALAVLGILIAILGLESIRLPFACETWMLRRHGLALAAVCLIACAGGGDGAVTRLMVRTTFGVYLMHPLVFQVLREMRLVDGYDWSDFVLVYVLSAAGALAMRAGRLKRFV